MVVERYTLSVHEKSRLRPMLEAWRNQKLSAEEETLYAEAAQTSDPSRTMPTATTTSRSSPHMQKINDTPKGRYSCAVNEDCCRILRKVVGRGVAVEKLDHWREF